ncbi:acetyltransferase (GNAT) family protein [Bacillus oleivorans]|uniref:Acetyltransferase (GNAT) family protein n=1 Tax=Bacillus oleivorans TaxID=1448271 RepID=A0A285D6R7_9BACI|nr:GNAT family N-acetyltransferase [Bacillus oleivorans]SNX75502.1 acetyltransferase (GNAT) family protein [Bacillus oleivorans]
MKTIKNKLSLHFFNEDDIGGLISLSQSVGWDYDEHEIRTVLSSGKILGHKNEFGQIVSSAAIIPYDTHLASIGMVIVKSEYRGLGLGKETTQACIKLVSEKVSIMLIATPEGKPLYEKLGFKKVGSVHKFLCSHYEPFDHLLSDGCKAEALEEKDLHQVIELDKHAFGDSRGTFLRNRLKQAQQALVLKDESGNVIGFGFSILGPENLILGPIVAPDYKGAMDLINQLARNHRGQLRIDTPIGDDLFINYLQGYGFEKVSHPPIMILHSDTMPMRNSHLYGIAAQVFG